MVMMVLWGGSKVSEETSNLTQHPVRQEFIDGRQSKPCDWSGSVL